MAPFLWHTFGRPRSPQPTNSPMTEISGPHENHPLATLDFGDGSIMVDFEEETLWYEENKIQKGRDGIAVVKLGILIDSPSRVRLCRVECNTTFSQPDEHQFQGVHHCWPSLFQEQTHDEQNSHEYSGNFPTSSTGSDILLQNFYSQRAWKSGKTRRVHDTVKHTLTMQDHSRPYTSSQRRLFGAAVLQCAEGVLAVKTLLRASSKRFSFDLRVEESYLCGVLTSTQIILSDAKSKLNLCAPCIEIEGWVCRKTHHAAQNGIPGLRRSHTGPERESCSGHNTAQSEVSSCSHRSDHTRSITSPCPKRELPVQRPCTEADRAEAELYHATIPAAPVSGIAIRDMNSADTSEEKTGNSTRPLEHMHPISDGLLCEGSKISADMRQPRTFAILSHTWTSKFEFKNGKNGDKVVKVAVLDTGIDDSHSDFQRAQVTTSHGGQPASIDSPKTSAQFDRVKEKKNFCSEENHYQDLHGHGTQVAGIILRLAPRADLYIARICSGTVIGAPSPGYQQEAHVPDNLNPQPEVVVKAIEWAVVKQVDIINMSFGFERHSPEIRDALKKAEKAGIVIVAAMANHGMYKEAAWPARTEQDAIGIHSCKEMGHCSEFTTLPVARNRNFMVVGEGIMAHRITREGGGFKLVEGTSFATPVAASIVAMILAFANQERCKAIRMEYEKNGLKLRELKSLWGMENVLEKISKKRGEYSWIDPMLLWPNPLPVKDEVRYNREEGWRAIATALHKGP